MTRPAEQAAGQAAGLVAALRLASPALPVGGFAYSSGIESAVELGWVDDRASTRGWIAGLLRHSVGHLDLPVLARLRRLDPTAEAPEFARLESRLVAARESAEAQAQEREMGAALSRLEADLGRSAGDGHFAATTYIGAFATSAMAAHLSEEATLASYCYAWIEQQVTAAVRLVPLGQTDGQAVLLECLDLVPDVVAAAREIDDADIGAASPGLAIASAIHETQSSRLFRS